MKRMILGAALLIGACMTSATDTTLSGEEPHTAAPAGAPSLPPGTPRGYLDQAAWPDSLALLPAPPASDSPAFARDEAVRADVQSLRNSARWRQAAADAQLRFPQGATAFACAANIAISQERTPRTYALLGRTLIDVGLSTYRAKTHYQRTRPFVMHNTPTCFPADEAALRTDGSYPSGHSAAGWGWALVLTELVPDRANEILPHGRDFGESRVVCNAHWQSDVDAGRIIAAATVARLHADAAFQADLAAARAEIEAARTAGATPDANACTAEAAALGIEP